MNQHYEFKEITDEVLKTLEDEAKVFVIYSKSELTGKEFKECYNDNIFGAKPVAKFLLPVVKMQKDFTPSIEKEGVTESDIEKEAQSKYPPYYPKNVEKYVTYLEGIRKGLSLQDRREKWVSVEERLPDMNEHEKFEHVIVVVDKETWTDVVYNKETKTFHLNCDTAENPRPLPVKFWQPIPTPPLVEEKK